MEHCHIGVFVTSASSQGHVLLDRELYLPQAWTDDVGRCERAGIPPERSFATKPQLARQMLERAFDAAVPAAWVAGESVYGDHRQLREWLEERTQAYVLTVSGKDGGGGRRGSVAGGRRAHRPPGVGRAVAPLGGALAAPLASGALGPSESERPDRAHRVRRVCPGDDPPGNRGPGGRPPMDHRTVL